MPHLWQRLLLFCLLVFSVVPQRSAVAQGDPQRDEILLARRRIESLIERIEEERDKRPLEAARLFDTAWSLAVQAEDPVLELRTGEQGELPPGNHQTNVGSRIQLLRIFQSSPEKMKDAYEVFASVGAKAAINQAAGYPAELVRAIERYQFTQPARDALRALIQLRMSRGEFLSAALETGRLYNVLPARDAASRLNQLVIYWNANMPDEARSQLRALIRDAGGEKVAAPPWLGGPSEVVLPRDLSAVDSFFDQLANSCPRLSVYSVEPDLFQPLASFRRTGRRPVGPSRLQPAWSASVFGCVWNPGLEEKLLEIQAAILAPPAVRVSLNSTSNRRAAGVPIIVGDLLIYRGLLTVRAVNRRTGKLVWESSFVDGTLEGLLTSNSGMRRGTLSYPGLAGQLRHHLARANTAGQLTCADGVVFAVEEVAAQTLLETDRISPGATRPSNYLRVYDAQTGQSLGMLGGAVGADRNHPAPNPLAGFYVLGAPLVMGDRIYLMAENSQGIFLLQLNLRQLNQRTPPYSLRPVHSQLLCVPRFDLRSHAVRRFSGVSPSFGGGLLICNTCDEKIVAVSAEDHSVRWVYRYPSNVHAPELGNRDVSVIADARRPLESSELDMNSRWLDALPRILSDRILVTPRDSDRLFCLDLRTGRELWSLPRGDFQQLAWADEDFAVIAGGHRVMCVSTQTGDTLWVTSLAEGFVSGTTSSDGRVLQVPTSARRIVTLELRSGRVLVRQSTGSLVPGNLVSAGDSLYSQSLSDIYCLTADAPTQGDPRLARATSLLLKGDLDEGETLLRDLVAEDPAAARPMLRDLLMESLRFDRGDVARRCDELRELILQDGPDESEIAAITESLFGLTPGGFVSVSASWDRANYSADLLGQLDVLEAEALLRSGDESLAAKRSLMLLTDAVTRPSVHSDAGLIQSGVARVCGMIADSINERSGDSARNYRTALKSGIAEILRMESAPHARQPWLTICLLLGFPDTAWQAIEDQPDSSRYLRQLFLQLSADAPTQNQFLAALAAELPPQEVTVLRQRFRRQTGFGRIPDIESRVTLSGDFVSSHEVEVPAESVEATLWKGQPVAKELAARSLLTAGQTKGPEYEYTAVGPAGRFEGWSFQKDAFESRLRAIDAQGRPRWVFEAPNPVPIAHRVSGSSYMQSMDRYVVALGPILVVRFNLMLYVLDCSHASPEVPPAVLWEVDLLEKFGRLAGDRETFAQFALTAYQKIPGGLAPVGEISRHGVPICANGRLLMLDLLTGLPRWTLEGLQKDVRLTSSENRLFLISGSAGSIQQLRPTDGKLIKTVSLPIWWSDAAYNALVSPRDYDTENLAPESDGIRRQLSATRGTCLLSRHTRTAVFLELFDLHQNSTAWSLEFPAGTAMSNVVDGHVAIIEPTGTLRVVNTLTGRQSPPQSVQPIADCQHIVLRPCDTHWVIMTDIMDQQHEDEFPFSSAVQVNGHMYGVARDTGKVAWSQPIDHQWLRVLNPQSNSFPPVYPLLVLLRRPGIRAEINATIYDMRTGEPVYRSESLGRVLTQHAILADPEAQKIVIRFDRRDVEFQYQK